MSVGEIGGNDCGVDFWGDYNIGGDNGNGGDAGDGAGDRGDVGEGDGGGGDGGDGGGGAGDWITNFYNFIFIFKKFILTNII